MLDRATVENAVRARFTRAHHNRANDVFLHCSREGAPDEPDEFTVEDAMRYSVVTETMTLFRTLGIELGIPGLSVFGIDQPDGLQWYYLSLPGRQRVLVWRSPRPGHPEDCIDHETAIRNITEAVIKAEEAPCVWEGSDDRPTCPNG